MKPTDETMSDTPRTDAVAPSYRHGAYDRLHELACQLERELNGVIERLRTIESIITDNVRDPHDNGDYLLSLSGEELVKVWNAIAHHIADASKMVATAPDAHPATLIRPKP